MVDQKVHVRFNREGRRAVSSASPDESACLEEKSGRWKRRQRVRHVPHSLTLRGMSEDLCLYRATVLELLGQSPFVQKFH